MSQAGDDALIRMLKSPFMAVRGHRGPLKIRCGEGPIEGGGVTGENHRVSNLPVDMFQLMICDAYAGIVPRARVPRFRAGAALLMVEMRVLKPAAGREWPGLFAMLGLSKMPWLSHFGERLGHERAVGDVVGVDGPGTSMLSVMKVHVRTSGQTTRLT